MKHTSKRLQALVLVLAMCVSFLQIPSFATEDNGHSGDVIARRATFASDGSFTVTKSCDEHPNASEKVVSGKIVKDATSTDYIAVDKDGKELVDEVGKAIVNASNTKAHEPTCATNGTIKYDIIVDGKHFYSDTFETAPATGKHDYQTKLPAATTSQELYKALFNDTKHYSLVSDAATCEADGDAVFAQKCPDCGHVNEDEKALVKVKHSVGHTYIKDEADKTGNTDKIYTEELAAPTCKAEGLAIKYKVCKFCKDKFYIKADDELTTAKSQAKQNIVPTLNHTLKYTVSPKQSYQDVGDKDFTENDFKVDYECTACKGENVYDAKAKPVKAELVADKTDTPKFNCTIGSRTYKVTYEFTDYTKKNADGSYATGTADQEVTVKYYPAQRDDHKWGDIYVPDEDSVVKATCTKDGHYNLIDTCSVCGEKYIYATIKIPATGKHTAAAAKKENVVAATTKKGGSYDLVVRCADCGEIISSTHKTTAKIVVNASKINSVKNYKGKKAKVTVKKAASVIGYQIQYSTRKDFKGAKHVNTRKTSKYLTKLAKKKYYVRVRTYKTVDGKLYYSSWSGAKTVTIKK